jgi:ATP-dependent Zn protease
MSQRDLLIFAEIRQAVRLTIEQAYGADKEFLSHNRLALNSLAEALFSRGYLDRYEIDDLLAHVPLELPPARQPTSSTKRRAERSA